MKKCFFIGSLIVLFFNCKETGTTRLIDSAYTNTMNQALKIRAEGRVKYLELAGLFKLDSTTNTFGSADSNHFVLNIKNLVSTIGSINLSKEALTFHAADGVIITNGTGAQIKTLALNIDANGNSIILFHKQVKWRIITRSGALYLRVWDKKNPAIESFKGFKSYDLNSDFIIEGDFEYFETTHLEAVDSKLGLTDVTDFIGQVSFMYTGKKHSLDVGSGGFVMVGDLTSGETTYGGGRYLYITIPEVDGKVILDFNYLFNPPCAFSEFTTCLYPPRQNQLTFEIRAGERLENIP